MNGYKEGENVILGHILLYWVVNVILGEHRGAQRGGAPDCHGDIQEGVSEKGSLELISKGQLGVIKQVSLAGYWGRGILWETVVLKIKRLKTRSF